MPQANTSPYAKYFVPLDPMIHGRWDQLMFGPHGIDCVKHVLGCEDINCKGECMPPQIDAATKLA